MKKNHIFMVLGLCILANITRIVAYSETCTAIVDGDGAGIGETISAGITGVTRFFTGEQEVYSYKKDENTICKICLIQSEKDKIKTFLLPFDKETPIDQSFFEKVGEEYSQYSPVYIVLKHFLDYEIGDPPAKTVGGVSKVLGIEQ